MESPTLYRSGWYVTTSAPNSLTANQNDVHLEPDSNYHVKGMIMNTMWSPGEGSKWVPSLQGFQGAAPDGTQFTAQLWLGFNVLGSTDNSCQFGGTIVH
jgi:hypothetical protein